MFLLQFALNLDLLIYFHYPHPFSYNNDLPKSNTVLLFLILKSLFISINYSLSTIYSNITSFIFYVLNTNYKIRFFIYFIAIKYIF